jgi:N6-L-threonylcarbamoyladenine synthase
MNDHRHIVSLGRTRDDAAGEALDKGARILGLGYPGGPAIEKASEGGSPSIPLPRAWLRGSYDFSFSGLKTALWRLVQEKGKDYPPSDLAASFEEAIIDVLVAKTVEATQIYHVKEIMIAGGVAANKRLRLYFSQRSPIPVFFPSLPLCTDNAAMIASCGYFYLQSGHRHNLDLDITPNLKLG